MFFNPLTQYLLGVINSMPMQRSKKINNSSQQRVDHMAARVSWGLKRLMRKKRGGRPRNLPAKRYRQP